MQAQYLTIKLQQDVHECHTLFRRNTCKTRLKRVQEVSGTYPNITLELSCTIHIYKVKIKILHLGHKKLIICFWFPTWPIFLLTGCKITRLQLSKMLLIALIFIACMLCKYSILTYIKMQLLLISNSVVCLPFSFMQL